LSEKTTKYIKIPERTTYYGTEFIDYSGFSIGGAQNVRVGKSAIPITIDG
tara:strand:+ start:838 stop:987 length:150 start_codon:yes stop_codon:yes gene_type:complete